MTGDDSTPVPHISITPVLVILRAGGGSSARTCFFARQSVIQVCCHENIFISLQYLRFSNVFLGMADQHKLTPQEQHPPYRRTHHVVTEAVLRFGKNLGHFISRRVADPTDAEDILQEVFFELVEVIELGETVEQVSAWLYRVARFRIIDRFRKKKEQSLDALTDDMEGAKADGDEDYHLDLMLPSPQEGPDAALARKVVLQELQLAIDALPDLQREVFIAHELEGQSFKEMAVETGIPINTLLARKRYAVLALRQRLQGIYDELET